MEISKNPPLVVALYIAYFLVGKRSEVRGYNSQLPLEPPRSAGPEVLMIIRFYITYKPIMNFSNISLVQNKILCILVFCNSAYFL